MSHHEGMYGGCQQSMPMCPQQPIGIAPPRSGFGSGFALLIVLFILLIIIGATFTGSF